MNGTATGGLYSRGELANRSMYGRTGALSTDAWQAGRQDGPCRAGRQATLSEEVHGMTTGEQHGSGEAWADGVEARHEAEVEAAVTGNSIVLEVRCMGCDKLIAAPSDADWELFRLGIHVHGNDDCRRTVEARLTEGIGR